MLIAESTSGAHCLLVGWLHKFKDSLHSNKSSQVHCNNLQGYPLAQEGGPDVAAA